MFTSRAEYRLLLREDNADFRLTEKGRELGLVDEARWRRFDVKREALALEQARLESTWLSPATLSDEASTEILGKPLRKEQNLADLLRRPEIDYLALMQLPGVGPGVSAPDVVEQLEISARYSGYLERQHEEVEKHSRNENTLIPDALDYAEIRGLSSEIRQKLSAQRPHSIGQASRISGVTPAAISILLIYLKKRQLLLARSA
jgi:tRNA uridine 5-carboxymethylaminomethyl modification enzyme